MYKYILFDLDGTLIEPKEGITKCVQYALRKFDINIENLDELTMFIGPPLIDSFMMYYHMDEKTAKVAVEYYRERFKEKGILECELYDDVVTTLSYLKRINKKLVIATSKPEEFTKRILRRLDIDKYFDLIVGATFDGTRGEKSKIIEYALEQLNVNNLNEVIMIGDRKFDILGAKNNHIDSIGVTYGYALKNEFNMNKPTYLINNIKELYSIIK